MSNEGVSPLVQLKGSWLGASNIIKCMGGNVLPPSSCCPSSLTQEQQAAAVESVHQKAAAAEREEQPSNKLHSTRSKTAFIS
jgi:hypothetical protein